MRSGRLRPAAALRKILTRRRKGRREFSELWLAPSCPRFAAFVLSRACRWLGIDVRRLPA
jgi:hypothetical protein